MELTADVVIVGYGCAGAAAALAVSERGGTAIVLEKQGRERHTPSVRMSGGMVMMLDNAEAGSRYLDACAAGSVPAEVNRAWAERATDLRIEGTTSGYRRSLLIGVAFGAGWTPCIGPYLALILTILLNSDLASGAVLLLAYSLGLGVPFLLVAGGLGSVQRGLDWVRLHIRAVNAVGGTLVIVMGLLLLSGQLARLNQLFNFLPLLG